MNEVILRARVVVPMGDVPPIENGAIAISDGRIAGVGNFAKIQRTHRGSVVDLGEVLLMPASPVSPTAIQNTVTRQLEGSA